MKKTKLTRDIILATRGWNGGLGLIVPDNVGRILKELGIKDGYTVTKQVTLEDFVGVTKVNSTYQKDK